MREDDGGAAKFAQVVWDELLCFMTVRAESHECAEHLVQDVLVRAARQPETHTDPLRFRVWLYHHATEVIRERLRFANVSESLHEPLVVDDMPEELSDVGQRESEHCVPRLAKPHQRHDFSEILDLVALLDIEPKLASRRVEQGTRRAGGGTGQEEESRLRSVRFALLANLIKTCEVQTESGSTSVF